MKAKYYIITLRVLIVTFDNNEREEYITFTTELENGINEKEIDEYLSSYFVSTSRIRLKWAIIFMKEITEQEHKNYLNYDKW